jgi:hypothetical protein
MSNHTEEEKPPLPMRNKLLIFVNLVFFLLGVIVFYFSQYVQKYGWMDSLKGTEYESTANVLMSVLTALGISMIVLVVLGTISAWRRHRLTLILYAIAMLVVTIIFVVLTIGGFGIKDTINDWEKEKHPVEKKEKEFGTQFNEVYCLTQGVYWCTTAMTNETLSIFLPTLSEAELNLFPPTKGLNQICDVNFLAQIPSMKNVCDACEDTKKFEKYDKILEWAEKKCPRTAQTQTWCVNYLTNENSFIVSNENIQNFSPYDECRDEFLDIASDWSNKITFVSLAAAFFGFIIVILAILTPRVKFASSKKEYIAM